jgi:hypothetical protein
VKVNDVYRHFKGREYRVSGMSYCAEGDELVPRVEYTDLESGIRYSLSLKKFLEIIDRPEFDYRGPRFAFVR